MRVTVKYDLSKKLNGGGVTKTYGSFEASDINVREIKNNLAHQYGNLGFENLSFVWEDGDVMDEDRFLDEMR
jgi:hypothetical protein